MCIEDGEAPEENTWTSALGRMTTVTTEKKKKEANFLVVNCRKIILFTTVNKVVQRVV